MADLNDKLSIRTLAIVCLLVLYTVIALYLVDTPWKASLLLMPLAVLGVMTSVRRLISPYITTLIAVALYLIALVVAELGMSWLGSGLVLLHMVVLAILSLVLSEVQSHAATLRLERLIASQQKQIISMTRLQPMLAAELRRARRSGEALTLVLFGIRENFSQQSLTEIVNHLNIEIREFDQLFAFSRHEIGVMCVGTDKAGALRLAARIRRTVGYGELSIASFPADAVTTNSLIDALHATSEPEREPELQRAVVD